MIALKNLPDGRYIVGPITHLELTVTNGRAWLLIDRVLYGQFNIPYLLRINQECTDDSLEMLSAASGVTKEEPDHGR